MIYLKHVRGVTYNLIKGGLRTLFCTNSQRFLGSIIIIMFLISVFGAALNVNASLTFSGTIKIMPLGDSITEGIPGSIGYREKLYGDLINSGFDVDFVGSLSSGSGFDTDHEGHSGQTASWLNPRLNGPTDYLLNANPPDVILYHIGTNSLGGSMVVSYALAANETLRIIYEYDPDITVILAKIILTNGTDQNVRTQAYNVLLEGHAQFWSDLGYSIVVVDMENALDYPEDLADPWHPTAAGYEKMAGVWYDALDDLLSVSVFPKRMTSYWKVGILICLLLLLIVALLMKIFRFPVFGI